MKLASILFLILVWTTPCFAQQYKAVMTTMVFDENTSVKDYSFYVPGDTNTTHLTNVGNTEFGQNVCQIEGIDKDCPVIEITKGLDTMQLNFFQVKIKDIDIVIEKIHFRKGKFTCVHQEMIDKAHFKNEWMLEYGTLAMGLDFQNDFDRLSKIESANLFSSYSTLFLSKIKSSSKTRTDIQLQLYDNGKFIFQRFEITTTEDTMSRMPLTSVIKPIRKVVGEWEQVNDTSMHLNFLNNRTFEMTSSVFKINSSLILTGEDAVLDYNLKERDIYASEVKESE
jgi:hypothetical protein